MEVCGILISYGNYFVYVNGSGDSFFWSVYPLLTINHFTIRPVKALNATEHPARNVETESNQILCNLVEKRGQKFLLEVAVIESELCALVFCVELFKSKCSNNSLIKKLILKNCVEKKIHFCISYLSTEASCIL